MLKGHSVSRNENGDAFGVEYRPNKHWSLGIDWMWMFDKKGSQYPSWNYSTLNTSYRDRYIRNNANMITLSVVYSADFGTIFRSSKRNLNNSDNGSSLPKL